MDIGRLPCGQASGAFSWPGQDVARLCDFRGLWDELFPTEQARIVALLVERVDIGPDGLNFRLRMDGLGGLAREILAGDIEAAA